MSKYYEALERSGQQASQPPEPGEVGEVVDTAVDHAPAAGPATLAVTPLPIAPSVIGSVARAGALRRLNERIAMLTGSGLPVRLLVSGCRPGDGSSSVAGGLALDLSQRLGLRTLLVDGHFRHPTLQRLFGVIEPLRRIEGDGAGAVVGLQIRSSSWPHLELAGCPAPEPGKEQEEALAEIERQLGDYALTVIDLGVLRLDPRLLVLARPQDPIVLVVRYGHTERRELATTASALRAANRTLGGVVLNAAHNPIPRLVNRIFRIGVRDEL